MKITPDTKVKDLIHKWEVRLEEITKALGTPISSKTRKEMETSYIAVKECLEELRAVQADMEDNASKEWSKPFKEAMDTLSRELREKPQTIDHIYKSYLNP